MALFSRNPLCQEFFRGFSASLARNSAAPLPFIRSFHTTLPTNRVQAGKYRSTQYKTRGLTYEQYYNPTFIGFAKGWNSWNTSNLRFANTEHQTAQITIYDMFIRKFIAGTFHNMFVSEVIIKQRHNVIYIAGIVHQTVPARKMYFLIGYTEEFLGFFLKCPVKMELQSVSSKKDSLFTYI
ncbi:putative 28S ribosomal protein S24, mitochondrial [Hypsibius exemplaris]|uniref:28S ribosomal protein S24, mitochondrial n=1 Tax=Hypsibius exemplaris TaxID=2072580 RepID=A0A1W0X8E0_HYPEX|nr:putative 28S ribosomal protein S24, mitochondrial [Hypsibius exemplaris]